MIEDNFIAGVYGGLTLEFDKRRGVLYLHNRQGGTILRMCRIPSDIGSLIPQAKKSVVLNPDSKAGELSIETESGEIILSIRNAPSSIFVLLDRDGFTDITYGYHPVSVVPESGWV